MRSIYRLFLRPSAVKSICVSVAVHSAAVSAMYAWSMTTTDRFDLAGSRHVIQLAASLSTTSATTPLIEASPLEAIDQRHAPIQSEISLSPRDFLPDAPRTESHPLANLSPRAGLAESTDLVRLPVNRAEQPEQMPEINRAQPPRRARRELSRPPQPTAVPTEQAIGLDEQSPPQLRNNPPPSYPREAVARRLEGTVLLRLQIDQAGRVTKVAVVKSSGHAVLDQSAVDAVRSWHGRPAMRAGKPVATVEVLPVRFRL